MREGAEPRKSLLTFESLQFKSTLENVDFVNTIFEKRTATLSPPLSSVHCVRL